MDYKVFRSCSEKVANMILCFFDPTSTLFFDLLERCWPIVSAYLIVLVGYIKERGGMFPQVSVFYMFYNVIMRMSNQVLNLDLPSSGRICLTFPVAGQSCFPNSIQRPFSFSFFIPFGISLQTSITQAYRTDRMLD